MFVWTGGRGHSDAAASRGTPLPADPQGLRGQSAPEQQGDAPVRQEQRQSATR